MDLEHYGVELPVMPQSWTHYIGLDFAKVDDFLSRIVEEPDAVEAVSVAGHTWAQEHYSPKAVASRFLEMVGVSAGDN